MHTVILLNFIQSLKLKYAKKYRFIFFFIFIYGLISYITTQNNGLIGKINALFIDANTF